jgi:transaldolase/glucose-6-phosphate isomerase
MNRLQELETLGQSVWLDNLSRKLIRAKEIQKLEASDDLRGMTSNPSIFEKSISHGDEYDEDIKKYVANGEDVGQIFRHLSVKDIQDAADAFRPVYDKTKGHDGFISIEVSPYISADTAATVAEAKSLWAEIKYPNLMVKVPGTPAGATAIRELIASGLNINVTLLFGRGAYEKVALAYIEGLEARVAKGEDIAHLASVASVFVSRIDTKIDNALTEKLKDANCDAPKLRSLLGKVAIANAKLAYQDYKKLFSGARWEKLAAKGAKTQRLLWASTGTKNKAYPDTLYIDSLIGPDTVNTMPPETMDAFRDHGTPKATLEDDLEGAKTILSNLEAAGISLDKATDELVSEGVDLFADAADKLYGALAEKRAKILDGGLLRMKVEISGPAKDAVDAEMKKQSHIGAPRKLWQHDKTYWTGADEDKWLGWLDIVVRELGDTARLEAFAKTVEAGRITDVVLLGMGGSTLGSDVLAAVFGQRTGWPKVQVLDSTDPERIASVEREITLASTLFVVSSKSGSTLEPNILKDYFFDRVGKNAGRQFIAITDPSSPMEKVAKQQDFAHIFYGDPTIGGRFSVLSKFGLVPAAAMGLDVKRMLTETQKMVVSCAESAPPAANPGVQLGIILGALARDCHRDKVTIVASKTLSSVGTWMEQLIAESTGKHGKGLIPIDREPLGVPQNYGDDRVFLHIHLVGSEDRPEALAALVEAGHPVVTLAIEDSYQIGQIFYACEIAIAIVGAVIGINPFDQPDVEAAKVIARDLAAKYESSGKLDIDKPLFEDDGLAVYADDVNREGLKGANTLDAILRAHFARISKNDYAALLAFMEQTPAHQARLQALRLKLRDHKAAATCLEFGPRYLHSTGQAYKGGPNSGVFLVISTDHKHDLAIPGRKASFGTIQLAQAIGDFSVLNQRARRALRIHLKDTDSGLKRLSDAADAALA